MPPPVPCSLRLLYVWRTCSADKCIQATAVDHGAADSPACLHEYHTLGTSDHVTASLKLAVLFIILLTNVRTNGAYLSSRINGTVLALDGYRGRKVR